MTGNELVEDLNNGFHVVVLRAIRDRPGIHGVALRQAVADALGRDISIGSLYVTLEVLEETGWIACTEEPGGPERGAKPKACWHLRKAID